MPSDMPPLILCWSTTLGSRKIERVSRDLPSYRPTLAAVPDRIFKNSAIVQREPPMTRFARRIGPTEQEANFADSHALPKRGTHSSPTRVEALGSANEQPPSNS